MIGLSLAGGGARGAYQVGAYQAFKKCHIKIDGFVGTSIGSFNAAMLAAGREKELLDFWQQVNIGKLLGFSDEYLESLNKEDKSNNVFTHVMGNFKDIVINKGIKTDALEQMLSELNLEPDIRKNSKDFGLVTVRVKDMKPLYMFKEDMPDGKINEFIMASCYLPVFNMKKIIDDSYYLDGGFYDNAPTNMLLDKGYDKVYVIDLSSIGIKRKVKDKSKVITIRPSRDLKSILNTNMSDVKNNIKLGYCDTIRVLKNLDGSKYIFKVYNPWIYKWIIRKVDPEIRKEAEKLFHTFDDKTLIIKCLEHIMFRNNYEYTNIYNPIKIIKEIKKMNKKYGIYKFINELKIL